MCFYQNLVFVTGYKPTLDKEELSNYRPISNLSVISKIIECVVKSRLTEQQSTNNLSTPHQSAYFEISIFYFTCNHTRWLHVK